MEKKEVKEQLETARKSMGFVPEIQRLMGEDEILDTLGVVYVTAGAPGVSVCREAIKKLLK
ncbi:MAG: hypothetical protein OIN88_08420 [Candidatus Methanoperedens sp.]|nr:hypothetical protein [Candidatus Methanoperedens sp.]